jgi:hypothetical protein
VGYVGYIWLYGCNGLWNYHSKYRVIPIAPKKTFFRRACWLPLQNNLRLHAYTDTYNMWIYIYTCIYIYIHIIFTFIPIYTYVFTPLWFIYLPSNLNFFWGPTTVQTTCL